MEGPGGVRALLRGIGLDLLLPAAIYAGLAVAGWPAVWAQRDAAVGFPFGSPAADVNGTLWFYTWLRHATATDHPLLLSDAVCAPTGQFIGANFPNRVDAHLAAAFLDHLPVPLAWNLFFLALPTLAGLSAYALARQVTDRRLPALLAGVVFGYQSMVSVEITQGRPVTALLAPFALLFATWVWALRARGGVAVLATLATGAAASLAVQTYAPHGLYLAFGIVLIGLGRVFVPAEGVPRWRPVAAGVPALALAVALTGPYLHELVHQRPFAPRAFAPGAEAYADQRSDPAIWSELRHDLAGMMSGREDGHPMSPVMTAAGFDPHTERGPYWQAVQAESLNWDWAWAGSENRVHHVAALGWVWLVAGIALGLAGGRRSWGWLALAFAFWVWSLGPTAAWWVIPGRIERPLVGGEPVRLPTAWLLDLAPGLGTFFRPYRAAPFVHLFLGVAMAAGLSRWAPRWEDGRRAGWIAAGLVALGVGAAGFHQTVTASTYPLSPAPWRYPAFLDTMAADPDDYAIVELPMGYGQHTMGYYAIHGKRRTEGLFDFIPEQRHGKPPVDCYRTPFLTALWWLGWPDSPAPLTPEAVAGAAADGLRYVLVWRNAYGRGRGGDVRSLREIEAALEASLGPPVDQGAELTVYRIPGS